MEIDNETYIITKLNTMSSALTILYGRLNNANLYQSAREKAIQEVLYNIKYAEELIDKFKIKNLKFNSFCNELVLFKKFNIPEVDRFLQKYHYEEMLASAFDATMSKIDENEVLTHFDYRVIETQIHVDGINDIDKSLLFESLIKEILTGRTNISMEAFTEMMLSYTKLLMKRYEKSPQVALASNRELDSKKAYTVDGIIYLNREELQSMYTSGSLDMLRSIYIEIDHLRQRENIYSKKKNDPITILERKEDIIISEIKGYYDENKDRIISEIEAEINAADEVIGFTTRNDIQTKGVDSLIEKNRELKSRILNKKRSLNGTEVDMDSVFNALIIQRPDLFDLYNNMSQNRS